ncbi:MAG: ABC transporter permease, partial [Parcubacteria group bacterium]|nr:ABC transporter permease [Parcubacteria group bacterium]
MFTIFWRTIKDKKVFIIIYCLAAFMMMFMYVAMYPSIEEKSGEFNQLMENYPEGMMKAFNIETISFDKLENFLSLENYSIIWPLMAMFMMVSLAGYSISKEIEKGTAEILLAKPISRLKIYFSRYLTGVVVLLLFAIVSVFSVVPLAEIYDIEYAFDNHVKIFVLSFLFGWAVFSVSLMFSAMFSEKGRTYALSGGFLLIMYVMNLLASLKEDLENLKYTSFFYYYDFNKAMIENNIEMLSILVFVGVAAIC